LWFSLVAFAEDSLPKEKDPQPVILVSGSPKAVTLRELHYACASRSSDAGHGEQQHQIAELKYTWAKYAGPQS